MLLFNKKCISYGTYNWEIKSGIPVLNYYNVTKCKYY